MNITGILMTALVSVIGYLIGSIPFGIIITKYLYKDDIRKFASKNPGATNVARVLGLKWGLIVMFLDMSKVVVTMFLAFAFSFIKTKGTDFSTISYYVPALFTIIGHSFPIFFKFKGGKGISCFFALLLMTNPLIGLVFFIGGFIIYVILKKEMTYAMAIMVFFVSMLCWIPQVNLTNTISVDGTDLANNALIWFNYLRYLTKPVYYDSIVLINIVLNLSAVLIFIVWYIKTHLKKPLRQEQE